MRLSCLEAPTPSDRGDISGQSTRFFTTNAALRAVKGTEGYVKHHVDLTRQYDKVSVTTSAVLHCIYLAWRHPRRQIEVTFQVSRPTFLPRTWPCVRPKGLKALLNTTLNSPDSMIRSQLQRAQFYIAFILPGGTHAGGSWRRFRSIDPLSYHEHDGLECGQKYRRALFISWLLPPTL